MRYVLIVLCACSSAPPPPLVESCKTERTWTMSPDCEACRVHAIQPKCDCLKDSAAGACLDQYRNTQLPDCTTDLDSCVSKCGPDCACADTCYAQHAACRTARADLEGCIVRTCDARCR